MKPSQVKKSLKHLISRKRPVFIWGPPGGGKSEVVGQVCAEEKLVLRDVRLNLLDPVDLKGFPEVTGTGAARRMSFIPPSFLPTKGKGVLFLDEMNSAPRAVQAAAYQLILDRKIGDYELPAGWTVVAAGNRAGDRAVVNDMPSPLANRLVHIDFVTDPDDWQAWAINNGVSDITRGFIKFRPNLLHAFNPTANARAFPTPRSWRFVDDSFNSGLDADTEYELIKGTVGEGAAAEFLAFAKLARDLPTFEEVMLNPDGASLPKEPASMYAICTMLDKKATNNNLGNLLNYMKRMPADFQVLFVKSAAVASSGQKHDITKSKEFVTWAEANQDALL